MQIAIVLYPGFTALDFIGPYEVLRYLPDAEVRLSGTNPGLSQPIPASWSSARHTRSPKPLRLT